MKRIISLVLIFILALGVLPVCAAADEFDPESVSTPYICLMDAATGTVLYEKNSKAQAYPASTTKIMTCILAIENAADINEIVNTGSDVEKRGSTCHFSRNEEMPLIDMLYGMMMFSGNDAAKAIAEHIGGSESGFADMMNKKAAELGMTGTHFVKPNGLHKEDHYSTAYDMAVLTRYAMRNETFRKIVSTATYNAAPTNKDSDGYQWYNSNRLLYTKEGEADYKYKYATGVKTGDTTAAGRCLVASAEKDGVELILVLFGDYDSVQAFAQDCRRVTDAVQQCSALPDELRIAWAPDNDPGQSLTAGTLQRVEQYTLELDGIAQLDWTAEQMAKQTEIQYLLDEENEETAESKDASVESAELSE